MPSVVVSGPTVLDKQISKQKALVRTRSRVLRDQSKFDKSLRDVWRLARQAPCFAKRGKHGVAAGKLRAHALISNHAFKIAAAGAGMKIQREQRNDAAILRLALPEESKTPFMPPLSSGAQVLIEQFICAFVQV